MAYMASWGPMGFVVSPQKIITLEKFTTSMTLKEDSENDTSGTEPTNTRGRELVPMAFSETCVAAAGIDPLQRYNLWCALLGEAYPLMIGANRIGPARMKLKNVSMSDVTLSAKGDIIRATLSISLEEWSEGKTSALLEEEQAEEGTEETGTEETQATGATGATSGTGATGGGSSATTPMSAPARIYKPTPITETTPMLSPSAREALTATMSVKERIDNFVMGKTVGITLRNYRAYTTENPILEGR